MQGGGDQKTSRAELKFYQTKNNERQRCKSTGKLEVVANLCTLRAYLNSVNVNFEEDIRVRNEQCLRNKKELLKNTFSLLTPLGYIIYYQIHP